MNIRITMKRLIMMTLIASALVIPQGCGKDTTYTAPFPNSVVISPEAYTVDGFSNAGCNFAASEYMPVRITVLHNPNPDVDPVPVANAAITINVKWAAGSSTGVATTVNVYDADKGTLAVMPYTTSTSDHGTKDLILQIDLSCDWVSSLEVFSGTAYQTMEITVN